LDHHRHLSRLHRGRDLGQPLLPPQDTDVTGKVRLKDCQPGVFLFEDAYYLKTEYGEAYACRNGEFFWGVTTSHNEERGNLMVCPAP
jgi:hypothetical protein